MANLVKKKIKGKIYWYIGESKRINGRVKRIWQKYLGPAEKVAQQLIEGTTPQEVEVLNLGLCAAMLNINEEIRFTDIVNNVISKREQGLSYGEHFMFTLINRLDNPVSKNKFGEWFDGTVLKRICPVNKHYLSSQSFWNHWNNISEKDIEDIQEQLLEKIIPLCDISELCFDPTNFSTYIEEHKNQKIMQFGRAKDGRKGFRQVNLSLLVTKKEGIPLWHHTYDGNINDVTEFKDFVNTLISRVGFFTKKCKKITLVFDKGNNSQNNMKNVSNKLGFFIVGSLKPSQFSDLFNVSLDEFKDEYITSGGKKVFATSIMMKIYDGNKKVVLTYSNELAYKNKVRVEKALNSAFNKLKNLQGRIKNTKLTRDELLIKVHDIADKQYLKGLIKYEVGIGNALKFELDEFAYKEMSKRFGKNILFTDDLSLETIEVIKIYSSKNIVEEQIKNLKDTHMISFTPMWCWTDRMIRVHAFTCVMALLFLRLLVKRAEKISLSQEDIIAQLQKIKLTLFKMPKSEKIHLKITRPNEHQRELIDIFDIKKYT